MAGGEQCAKGDDESDKTDLAGVSEGQARRLRRTPRRRPEFCLRFFSLSAPGINSLIRLTIVLTRPPPASGRDRAPFLLHDVEVRPASNELVVAGAVAASSRG